MVHLVFTFERLTLPSGGPILATAFDGRNPKHTRPLMFVLEVNTNKDSALAGIEAETEAKAVATASRWFSEGKIDIPGTLRNVRVLYTDKKAASVK